MKKTLLLLGALCCVCAMMAQSNVITYTAISKLSEGINNGEIGTDKFNVAITSHEFANGTGTITFSGPVTTIGSQAFYACPITSITLPSTVTSLGMECFRNCAVLESITLPANLTSLGSYAFSLCTSLTSVTIPKGVTVIEDYTFQKCSSLTTFTVEKGVKSIGQGTFDGCSNLKSVSIPITVTSIGREAFYNCTSLDSITLPAGISTIEANTFQYCSNLQKVDLPKNLVKIGYWAFYECSELQSIALPASVDSIKRAFDGCVSLTSITCDAINPPYCSSKTFNNVDKTIPLMVPDEASKAAYSIADEWKEFTNICIPATGLDEIDGQAASKKVLRDGQVLIINDGKTYNVQGAAVE